MGEQLSRCVKRVNLHKTRFAFHGAPGHRQTMIDPPDKIGERLHRLRIAVDLNQARLAETLGITQSAWSQYESGTRKITIEGAGTLAARFGVTLDWIYRGDPSGLPMRMATLLGL